MRSRLVLVAVCLAAALVWSAPRALAAPDEGDPQPTQTPSEEQQNPLVRIIEMMHQVEEILVNREMTPELQALQQEIVRRLADPNRDQSQTPPEMPTAIDPAVDQQQEISRELDELIHQAEHSAGQ